jgi:spore coat polysaccharide biosynthesis protein SpsF
MRVVAIIQARMGSTRLPGKVLMDLGGEPVLVRVVERTRRAKTLDEIVVATSDLAADNAIAQLCVERSWHYFRGSAADVLDRYYRAAVATRADVIVRITADCPLIDPDVVDLVVGEFLKQGADYASDDNPRTFPRGLDAEVLTFSALERAWNEGKEAYQREHVTPFVYEHPEWFSLISVHNDTDYSQYRWTLDNVEDLELLHAVYQKLGNRDDFGWREVLALMEREPELAELNAHVVQKPLHQL